MIVYVGAGSGDFRDKVIAAGHGQMVSPQPGAFRMPESGRWAFDNGAWTDFMRGERFDPERYFKRIAQIMELPASRRPDWCVVPDEVAAPTSLVYSLEWKSTLAHTAPGLRWYLALQDGMSPEDIEHALLLERFDGLFVGGSTGWKLDTGATWVQFGHERKLPVHIARVNGPNRLQWAVDIGADSVDGTGWVRAGEKWLPWLEKIPAAKARLFEQGLPEEAFEAYLKEIWSDPAAWSSRMPEEGDDDWERYDVIAAMGPVEFVTWYRGSYPGGHALDLATAEAMDEEEFQGWKFGLVDEAERFLGKRPVRPERPLARFVQDETGQMVPLGFALNQKATPAGLAPDGRPQILWKGRTVKVISAESQEAAQKAVAGLSGSRRRAS